MKRFLNIHFMLAVHLVAVALVIVIATWSVHAAKGEARAILEDTIETQMESLSELAIIIDSNGADEVVSRIISDCPNRAKFESLLVKLGTLSHKDLLETQKLFDSCGGFYSERKALMVSRFEREYTILKNTISLLQALENKEDLPYSLENWNRLIELEVKRSDMLTEQTEIQETIIVELIAGSTSTSAEVRDLVKRAQELGQSLEVLGKQIDEVRKSVVS